MPWQETDEHNQRLFDALTALSREKGALERLAGAINADDRAQASDRARQGSKHKPRKTLVTKSDLLTCTTFHSIPISDLAAIKF